MPMSRISLLKGRSPAYLRAQGEDWSFGGGRPAASLLGIRS
jgi:hypothetical protein